LDAVDRSEALASEILGLLPFEAERRAAAYAAASVGGVQAKSASAVTAVTTPFSNQMLNLSGKQTQQALKHLDLETNKDTVDTKKVKSAGRRVNAPANEFAEAAALVLEEEPRRVYEALQLAKANVTKVRSRNHEGLIFFLQDAGDLASLQKELDQLHSKAEADADSAKPVDKQVQKQVGSVADKLDAILAKLVDDLDPQQNQNLLGGGKAANVRHDVNSDLTEVRQMQPALTSGAANDNVVQTFLEWKNTSTSLVEPSARDCCRHDHCPVRVACKLGCDERVPGRAGPRARSTLPRGCRKRSKGARFGHQATRRWQWGQCRVGGCCVYQGTACTQMDSH